MVKTADKMLKEAEQGDMLGDEERAYVLYMKYFNVVTFLKKSADYKKQKVKLNTRPYASYAGLSIFFNTTSTSLFTGGIFS